MPLLQFFRVAQRHGDKIGWTESFFNLQDSKIASRVGRFDLRPEDFAIDCRYIMVAVRVQQVAVCQNQSVAVDDHAGPKVVGHKIRTGGIRLVRWNMTLTEWIDKKPAGLRTSIPGPKFTARRPGHA